MIIDFHNHFYPPEYLDAIRRGPSNVRVTLDSEGNPLLHYPGDYNVAVAGHRDIALAAAKLVFSGVVRRFPGIRWVLAHLGGAVPYLAERLDRGYEAFRECRRHIDRPPSEYLHGFYYDTVNFDPAALRLAVEFAGVDHLLAGSDYPHQIGSLEKMEASIAELGLDLQGKAKVLAANARRLLALEPKLDSGDAVG